YSRRIVSNISILALLCILPACQIKPRQVFKGGPNQAIEMGQIRVAKSASAFLACGRLRGPLDGLSSIHYFSIR
ncbi:MAG: hypothetical protein ACK5ZJ_19125, partial [Acidobacteriota bacterium]